MAAPLFSVVTPCLDPGPRLERCLASVAAQRARVEHVVVDGGSTDGTVELLRRSEGLRWVSEPDAGQTNAINKGFALADGDYLTWLNADDELAPGAVERAERAFAAHPEAGLVYGDCRVVGAERGPAIWHAPRRFDAAAIEAGEVAPQIGAFVARWALDRVGPLDESFELAMDVDLWIRLVDAGVPTVRVHGVVATFELHAGSKSGSVPRVEFFHEQARAFAKSGRMRAAALALGRGAAEAAFDGTRVDDAALERELDAARARGRALGDVPDAEIVAAAQTEAAVLELRSSPRGLARLVRAQPWRRRELRARVRAAASRRALHALDRMRSR